MLNRRTFFRLLPLAAMGSAAEVKSQVQTLPHPITGYEMSIEDWRNKAMVYREYVERLIQSKEPSPWSEMTCQRESTYLWELNGSGVWEQKSVSTPACGTRFKFLHFMHTPICPKCGRAQDMSRDPDLRAKISGIEV